MSKGFAATLTQSTKRPNIFEAQALSQRLQNCFAELKDPRVERTRLHQLGDILIIAILSVLAGGQGWEDMQLYGESKKTGYLHFYLCQMKFLVPIHFVEYLKN